MLNCLNIAIANHVLFRLQINVYINTKYRRCRVDLSIDGFKPQHQSFHNYTVQRVQSRNRNAKYLEPTSPTQLYRVVDKKYANPELFVAQKREVGLVVGEEQKAPKH